jgi:hypothetical protein
VFVPTYFEKKAPPFSIDILRREAVYNHLHDVNYEASFYILTTMENSNPYINLRDILNTVNNVQAGYCYGKLKII